MFVETKTSLFADLNAAKGEHHPSRRVAQVRSKSKVSHDAESRSHLCGHRRVRVPDNNTTRVTFRFSRRTA